MIKNSTSRILRIVLFAAAMSINVGITMADPMFADRLETPIRLKIEGGNTDQVMVVLKNMTTGESNSFSGESKLVLSLKLNCDYIISFTKPGYVTKKIQVNTTIPADRAKQGLYPFPFDVYLFKQYEGVNFVVFNQPVGKISYNKSMDEFDYDTDYTKQIQSQIAEAEEQIKEKILEDQKKQKELEKEQVALKKKMDEEAKQALKAKMAEEKKLLAEARAAEETRKQAEKEAALERQKEMKAKAEEEKKAALAAREAEEQKRKMEAKAQSEVIPAAAPVAASENPQSGRSFASAEDPLPISNGKSGEDPFVVVSQVASGDDPAPPGGFMGSGSEASMFTRALTNTFHEPGQQKAKGYLYSETYTKPVSVSSRSSFASQNSSADLEPIAEVEVQEITEINRVITRVIVKKANTATVYSRVVYRWGGVYFFKNNLPISESMYQSVTASR